MLGDFVYLEDFMLMMKIDRTAILKKNAGVTNGIARGVINQLNNFEN